MTIVEAKIKEILEFEPDPEKAMLMVCKWLVPQIMPTDIGINSDVKSVKDKKQGWFECRQMIIYKLNKLGL